MLAKLAVSSKYLFQKASRSLRNVTVTSSQTVKERTESRSEFFVSWVLGSECEDSGVAKGLGLGREGTSAWFGVLTSVDTSGVHCRGKARRFPFDDEAPAVNIFSLLTKWASFGRFWTGGCAPSGASID